MAGARAADGAITKRRMRRDLVVRQILDQAWEQISVVGVGELSLRRLARELGLSAPSLYVYFDSKLALYDALFADAAREFQEDYRTAVEHPDAEEALRRGLTSYLRFALDKPARYQLHFQRPVPAFQPSESSFAIARETYELFFRTISRAVDAGVFGPAAVTPRGLDLLTAMSAGLAAQQLSNEPDADFATGRWTSLIDEAIEMQKKYFESQR